MIRIIDFAILLSSNGTTCAPFHSMHTPNSIIYTAGASQSLVYKAIKVMGIRQQEI